MSYLFPAAYVALAALYLFLASTGRPGTAAWCVSAVLAVAMAAFFALCDSRRGLERSQQELIEAYRARAAAQDDVIEAYRELVKVQSEAAA